MYIYILIYTLFTKVPHTQIGRRIQMSLAAHPCQPYQAVRKCLAVGVGFAVGCMCPTGS